MPGKLIARVAVYAGIGAAVVGGLYFAEQQILRDGLEMERTSAKLDEGLKNLSDEIAFIQERLQHPEDYSRQKQEIEKELQHKKVVYVLTAPWCIHCKPLEKRLEHDKGKYKNISIQIIDIEAKGTDLYRHVFYERKLLPYSIGLPTILIFENGTCIKHFQGYRAEGNLVAPYVKGPYDPEELLKKAMNLDTVLEELEKRDSRSF